MNIKFIQEALFSCENALMSSKKWCFTPKLSLIYKDDSFNYKDEFHIEKKMK
jgi:hypothetical protein